MKWNFLVLPSTEIINDTNLILLRKHIAIPLSFASQIAICLTNFNIIKIYKGMTLMIIMIKFSKDNLSADGTTYFNNI